MKRKKVNITVPVYNEEKELSENIKKLYLFCSSQLIEYDWFIVIADNASTDTTLSAANMLQKKYKNIFVLHLDEKGRGKAIRRSWNTYNAEYYCYMDIDLSTDLKHIKQMLIGLNSADVVIGSRLLPESKVINRTPKREIISRCYNGLIRFLFMTKFSDAQCGFKGITEKTRIQILPEIIDNEWFFDTELLIVSEKSGYKILEIPVIWTDNPGSTVRVLPTATGDLKGLYRLLRNKTWKKLKTNM
jgi:glycosyltransferase involved in cell wall biosynthesis